MLTRRTLPLLFAGACGFAAIAACTLDVNKYSLAPEPDAGTADTGGGPTVTPYASLRFEAVAMLPHTSEAFELRVVDPSDKVVAKMVLDRVIPNVATRSNDFSLFAKNLIPSTSPPYRLEFWFDHNQTPGDGGAPPTKEPNYKYDKPGKDLDHSWRRILSDPLKPGIIFRAPLYTVYFPHDQQWDDLNTDPQGTPVDFNALSLAAFNLKVMSAPEYLAKMFEYRVAAHATGQVVGLYRRTALDEGEQTLQITDIVDESTEYDVTAFVDMNSDQVYNPGEPSWFLNVRSASGDFEGTLNLLTADKVPIDNGNSNLAPYVLDDAGVLVSH